MPISPEIIDGFLCSRCLNDRINLPDVIGTFTCGTNAFLVAKNGTKKVIPLQSIKSTPVDGFWCLRFINDYIDLSDMMLIVLIKHAIEATPTNKQIFH